MDLTLKVWRQNGPDSKGAFQTYEVDQVSEHMSFLEMLDVLNERLVESGEEPIAFDSDCREGICGTCSMMINGEAHGPEKRTTACQLHMRSFKDGDTIFIEPWKAGAFPLQKDLMVDRSALDRVIESGGFVSINTGSAVDANTIPIPKPDAEKAMDAAECIGCGACVAACPNGSAMLFTAAKVSHLASLPQGQPERYDRVQNMIKAMDDELFGACTNHGECQEACPKAISISFISNMNRDYVKSGFKKLGQSRKSVKAQ